MWRKMLSMLFENRPPWITFRTFCNIRSPQQHVGVVHSRPNHNAPKSPPYFSATETAVCNLGSVNLVQHLKDAPTAKGSGPRQAEKTIRHGHAHARQRDRHQLLRCSKARDSTCVTARLVWASWGSRTACTN
jgi:ribonucleotide reductase alpha subunit